MTQNANFDFAKEEEKVLTFWRKFLPLQKKGPISNCAKIFYDGPSFANSVLHYGNILNSTVKDTITRYWNQKSIDIDTSFGWETHGLTIENEVNKNFIVKGLKSIKEYNKICRKHTNQSIEQCGAMLERLGRKGISESDFKTSHPWYMESVWWCFKEMYLKGLIYHDVRVLPYSTALETPLADFESCLNFKNLNDPFIIVSFPLVDEPGVSVLACTSEPWTIPSNVSLSCNPELEYIEIVDNLSGQTYVCLDTSLSDIYKDRSMYTVHQTRKGSKLIGMRYKPLFSYFKHMEAQGAFKILSDRFITRASVTGVVHLAPHFNEEDYRCCLDAAVITKYQAIVSPVDSRGCFIEPITDFLGKYVKDTNEDIIKHLEATGNLFHRSNKIRTHPFCWISDTPLIYKAVPSWFVRVEYMKDKLLENNSKTNWVPVLVKEKFFGKWLSQAKDWSISRNTCWGTPIPIWVSDDGKEVVCVGSIAELEELTGQKISDLHRENIDQIKIPSQHAGHPKLRRVSEVLDSWFESGCLPYACMHYPFEHKEDIKKKFPADFIVEGIDQTRGWFYSLLVVCTALLDETPCKDLITHGLVLAADGQKLSKCKKNYPNPHKIIDEYGADSLRLYLVNSPAMQGEHFCFDEAGVRNIKEKVLLPWLDAFQLLVQNIERYEYEEITSFEYVETNEVSSNIMDRWILSITQTLLQFLEVEMQAYRLYNVVPRLLEYIDNLAWYVRMNYKRIEGNGDKQDCRLALNTLFRVVYTMARVNAPFTPFLAEFMFQRLRKFLPPSHNTWTIHCQMIPDACVVLIDEKIEGAVASMQSVIKFGAVVRDRKSLAIDTFLPEIVVVHDDVNVLNNIVSLKSYILEELNVKELTITTDKKYGMMLRTEEQDLRMMFNLMGPAAEELSKRFESHSEGDFMILLDVTPDETMRSKSLAREVMSQVLKLRKKGKFVPLDEVTVYYEVKNANSVIAEIMVSHKDFIESTTRMPQKPAAEKPTSAKPIVEETVSVNGVEVHLALVCTRTTESKLALRSNLLKKIKTQVEFYLKRPSRFVKDELKRNEGWLPLDKAIKFKDLKSLTNDRKMLFLSLKLSSMIELSRDKKRIRKLVKDAEKQSEVELLKNIMKKIEFYFGDANMQHDKILNEQTKLDEGWVPVKFMLKYKLLKSMSKDVEVILKALEESKLIEISEDKKKIRRALDKPLPAYNDEYRKAQEARTVHLKGFPLDANIETIKSYFESDNIEYMILKNYERCNEHFFNGSVFLQFKNFNDAKAFMEQESVIYEDRCLVKQWLSEYFGHFKLQEFYANCEEDVRSFDMILESGTPSTSILLQEHEIYILKRKYKNLKDQTQPDGNKSILIDYPLLAIEIDNPPVLTLHLSCKNNYPHTKIGIKVSDSRNGTLYNLKEIRIMLINSLPKNDFTLTDVISVFEELIPRLNHDLMENLGLSTDHSLACKHFQSTFTNYIKLGAGTYGYVLSCKNRIDNDNYAVKIITLDSSVKKLHNNASNEINILKSLNHSNICRYFTSWVQSGYDDDKHSKLGTTPTDFNKYEVADGSYKKSKKNDGRVKKFSLLFVQMELCECNMRNKLDDGFYVNNNTFLWKHLYQIVDALAYIHSENVLHRDLKPENILIKKAR